MLFFFAMAFVAILFIVVVWVSIMFLIPQLRILGIGRVAVARVYTNHTGPVVENILSNRNLIIEASNVEVRIHFHKEGFHDAGSITVFEDVSGIGFNNMERSFVNLYQTYVAGVVHSHIRVSEPVGILPGRIARVYIHLFADDFMGGIPFNFILRTGRSAVTFYAPSGEEMFATFNSIRLENTRGTIRLPNAPTVARPFEANIGQVNIFGGNPRLYSTGEVGSIFIDGAPTSVLNLRDVRGSVDIDSNGGTFNFHSIGGNLTVNGRNVTVASLGAGTMIGGNVYWSTEGTGSSDLTRFGVASTWRRKGRLLTVDILLET